jgi:ribose 1,5-bisphosphokinase PhnN
VKKLYQPYYSRRGRPTKEEQAERLRQEQKRLQGSGFLEILHDGDTDQAQLKARSQLHQN